MRESLGERQFRLLSTSMNSASPVRSSFRRSPVVTIRIMPAMQALGPCHPQYMKQASFGGLGLTGHLEERLQTLKSSSVRTVAISTPGV